MVQKQLDEKLKSLEMRISEFEKTIKKLENKLLLKIKKMNK
tara:strand:+ start:522 stop:644 length:123 start_codon:yes stop_codon:yes gene_type:complete